jgi:hypothetical protein
MKSYTGLLCALGGLVLVGIMFSSVRGGIPSSSSLSPKSTVELRVETYVYQGMTALSHMATIPHIKIINIGNDTVVIKSMTVNGRCPIDLNPDITGMGLAALRTGENLDQEVTCSGTVIKVDIETNHGSQPTNSGIEKREGLFSRSSHT